MANKISLIIAGLIVLAFSIACIFFPYKLQQSAKKIDTFKIIHNYYSSELFILFTRVTGIFLLCFFCLIIYLLFLVVGW
jgi:hypothetical protein